MVSQNVLMAKVDEARNTLLLGFLEAVRVRTRTRAGGFWRYGGKLIAILQLDLAKLLVLGVGWDSEREGKSY